VARMLFHCTHGQEDPERATLPFLAANLAAQAGQDAVVLLTVEGAWLGRRGGAEGIAHSGLPRLLDVIDEFVDNGGTIWVGGSCARPRGITEDQLVKGARIVGAATVLGEIATGRVPVAIA
jgi:predicted peroxiredoxin